MHRVIRCKTPCILRPALRQAPASSISYDGLPFLMRMMAAGFDLPAIFLLPTRIDPEKLVQLENQIPTLTFDIKEAGIILGRISKKDRAKFELRSRGLNTTEVPLSPEADLRPFSKRRKLAITRGGTEGGAPSTAADGEGGLLSKSTTGKYETGCNLLCTEEYPTDVIKVVQLEWFTKSVSKGQLLPIRDFLIYQGLRDLQVNEAENKQRPKPADILKRARDKGENAPSSQTFPQGYTTARKTQPFSRGYSGSSQHPRTAVSTKRPPLLLETTTEHDIDQDLPPIPSYLHTTYSCERPTPFNPPNDPFIEELKKIRTTRLLTGDKVGVRAYSSCIASLAAYPYLLQSQQGMS